jgi:outer membrane immunogenic protein
MNKFVVASLAAAVIASPAAAAPFEGAYAGIAATLDNVQGSGALEGFGANGVGGSVFAGYDIAIGSGFAGVEGNVDLNTADPLGIEAKWGWGVSGRAGLKLNEATGVYGRIGYQRNKIGATGLGSAWGDGVRFGAGVETGLTDSASLRVEFNHVNYESDIINNQAVVGVLFRF